MTYTHDLESGQQLTSEDRRRLLGGKGASLVSMATLGLPVPPAFTITTDTCRHVRETGDLPEGLIDNVMAHVGVMERRLGRSLGDPEAPLLLSVRSGAPISMPGMLDTVLNLGISTATVAGLAGLCGHRFAVDATRRFVECFGSIVLGLPDYELTSRLGPNDAYWDDDVVELLENAASLGVPDDPIAQLEAAILAVFRSWDNERAVHYRELEGIDHDLGTAVTIQAMVFGNLDDHSGSGVAFTRDPSSGDPGLFGDFLFRSQGEDVVSGRRATLPLSDLSERLPEVHADLHASCDQLEEHIGDMADVEFTVEAGKLWFLQVRRGKRAAAAAVRIAADLAEEGRISREDALLRISERHLERLAHARVDARGHDQLLTTGLGACPGIASGHVCLSAEDVEDRTDGAPTILVRQETSPADVHGMALADGVLTTRGGLVSHAALIARDLAVPTVVGAADIEVDLASRCLRIGDVTVEEDAVITIDGASGDVYQGQVRQTTSGISPSLQRLLEWADGIAPAEDELEPAERIARAQKALRSRIPA